MERIDCDKQILFKADLQPQDRTLVKVLKGDIPDGVVTRVEQAMKKFRRLVKRKKNGQKKKKFTKHARKRINNWSYHVGVWTTQGGTTIVPTAASSNEKVNGIEEFRQALVDCGLLTLVDQLTSKHFRHMALAYKSVNNDPKAITRVFKTMAINMDGISQPHVDGLDYDDGMCLVIPFGNYEGVL